LGEETKGKGYLDVGWEGGRRESEREEEESIAIGQGARRERKLSQHLTKV
jgi:hypothetical protein